MPGRACREVKKAAATASARALSGPLVLMPHSGGRRLDSVTTRLPGTCAASGLEHWLRHGPGWLPRTARRLARRAVCPTKVSTMAGITIYIVPSPHRLLAGRPALLSALAEVLASLSVQIIPCRAWSGRPFIASASPSALGQCDCISQVLCGHAPVPLNHPWAVPRSVPGGALARRAQHHSVFRRSPAQCQRSRAPGLRPRRG